MLEQQTLIELLSINEQNIDDATARKIIASYAAMFNELESVCQLVLEFSDQRATLNKAKFLVDIEALICFGTSSLDFLNHDDYEDNQLTKTTEQLHTFITCFNQLDHAQRIITYYSYLKNESASKIVQKRLNAKQRYSVRTFYRKKNEASILLVKKIKWFKIKNNKATL